MAARFFNLARTLSLSKTLTLIPNRHYIAEMRRSAFRDTLLRHLRSEISSASSNLPSSPPTTLSSFAIDALPGQRRIQLTRTHRSETVKIDATTVDGAAPSTRSNREDSTARFHISLVVEVSKSDAASELVLQFVCSAWPDALDVEKVCAVKKEEEEAEESYMGPDFGELDMELQEAVRDYLEERGVNDELAEFLHRYAEEKNRVEKLRWLKNVQSYMKI